MKRSILIGLLVTAFQIHCFSQKTTGNSNSNKSGNLNALSKKGEVSGPLNHADSLYVSLSKTKADTNKVKKLNNICSEYVNTGDYAKAIICVNEMILISKKNKFKKGLLAAYTQLGNVSYAKGDFPGALKQHFKSLKVCEEINYKRGMANNYNNIGSVYSQTGNHTDARKYFSKLLKISAEISYHKGTALAYDNLGIIYDREGKSEEALASHLKALEITEKSNDQRAMSWAYQNIAIVYGTREMFNESMDYFLKAYNVQIKLGDKREMSRILGNMGQLLLMQKKYKEAIEYCERGLAIAEEIKFPEGIKGSEVTLSELYERTGDFKKALFHYKKYTEVKDGLINEENTKKIVRVEMNYNFEKQLEDKKAKQDKKDLIANANLTYQKTLSIASIAGLALVLIITFLLIIGYRNKIKTKDIIALKQKEISKQQANIEGQEVERTRIAKELHDGLGGSLAGIKLNLERINSVDKLHSNELEKIISQVGDSCKEVRTISHNLTSLSFNNLSLTEALQGLIEKFIVPGRLSIQLDLFPEKEIDNSSRDIKNDIYRIIQECISNIIRHAEAAAIQIGVLQQDSFLYLSIEDNGKGFNPTIAKKGIGLINIESRVHLLKGEMVLDSKPGRGTAINIKIPV
ncbi:MAG: tetratricopeptide repeat protein [Flavobacteriales bacterium]